ncbi:MAG: hypothetical protein JXQ73_09585 [Phycisphaerae bacterium]|nr:hypothetical protein [Phycisphaerae bacterium]
MTSATCCVLLMSQICGSSLDHLEHGRSQVRAMLQGRPAMREHVEEGDAIWEWAARRFAGEELGQEVYWDPNSPRRGFLGEHRIPRPGVTGCIRLREVHPWGPKQGTPLSFEDLWGAAVFELFNITSAAAFLRLYDDARAGEIDRDGYVLGMAEIEYSAIVRTKRFWEENWLPWTKSKGVPPRPFLSLSTWQPSYEAWIRQFPRDPNRYPWRDYGKHYDTVVVPHLIRTGKLEFTDWRRFWPHISVGLWLVVGLLCVYGRKRFWGKQSGDQD